MNRIKKFQDICMQVMAIDTFAGVFISQMNKVFDHPAIPTAAVGFANGRLNLYVNLDFFFRKGRTEEFQRQIIFHELEHVIKGHLLAPQAKENPKRWNYATDAQINENKPALHAEGITAKKLKLEPHQTSIQFYKQIKDQQEQNKKGQGKGDGKKQQGDGDGLPENQLGNHDLWDSASEEEKKEIIKQAIKDSLNNMDRSQMAGSMAGEAEQLLEKFKEKPYASWKELRMFFGSLKSYNRINTRMRKNKRFGWMYSGKRWEQDKLKICVPIDTSGSVSDKMLKQFYNEIDVLEADGHEIQIIQCDAKVHPAERYNRFAKKFTVKGRGGTAYNPALEQAKKMECDIIIFFGDGGCFDNPDDPQIPVLWALAPGCDIDVNFGQRIYLKE